VFIKLNITYAKADELIFLGTSIYNQRKENNDKQEKTVEMHPSGLLMHYHSKAAHTSQNA